MNNGFKRPQCLNSIPNSIQTDGKFREIIGAQVFAFWHSSVLDWRPGSLDKYQNVEINSIYNHTKDEPNWFINVQMQGKANEKFLDKVIQELFSLFH